MFTILRDTREQEKGTRWTFSPDEIYCKGTEDIKLDTGDYTLKGVEEKFIIERKGCISEFATNVNEGRFARELERLQAFEHPFIVLEFTMDDIRNFPQSSSIPRKLWPKLRVTSDYLFKKLSEMEVLTKIKVILAGKSGKQISFAIFKRIDNKYNLGDK